eukprot:s2724_g1.t1
MKAVSTAEEAKSKEDDAKINVTVLTLSGETVATLTLGLQGGRVLEDSETASSLAWPSDVTLTKLVDHTGHAIDLTLELRMTFDYERPIALLRDPKSKTFGAMDADETRRMCAAMKETTQNLNALNYIFNTFGEPSKNGIDVMILLLCFKKKFPGQVHLLRGKHECSSIARIYGFYDECKHRFPTRSGVKLFKQFVEVFDSLPLVAVIQRLWSRVFCVSSGLSPKLEDLEELRKLQRPVEVGSDGLVCDLLWSDPDDHRPGWYEQDKGMSYTYGPDVDFIVHGTQVVDEGHEFFAAGKGVSIFSSPAFLGEFRNKASVLLLDEQLQQSLHTFDETMLPADALPSLHACITMDPSCQELGERLLEELRKQLKLSQSLRKCYGEIEVSTSLLVQGVWSVPQSQAVILLLTPEWLLTPLGAAALRAIFRLRSMQLGPEVLPLVHVNAFPDGPSSALNAPSGQLLREAASSGSWGCLDSNLGAAIPQAAAWAAQRLEIIFVREGAESGEDNTPANLASRRQEATGLTQTTWRRRSHESREKEPVEAVWQDFPQNGAKSPKRPRNMPSLNAGGVKGRNGEERGTDKTSLRHVAENAARHVDDMHQHREGLSRLPRRASEPGLHASISHKGVPKAIVKDWADAMRDVLGVPNAEGAFPEGESNSRRGSKDAPLPPVGDFMQPNSAPVPSEKPRRKSQVIPPLPEKGIRPASGIVKGECRRQWRVQELTLDDSFEEDLPPALQAAATVRHWAALALEKRPRTPGRDADEPQSAPATPHGRDQGWDHFGLLSTGFYLAEAMSPSAMRGIGVGIAAPDPFTGGTALSWEKTEDMDPSASWWGTHPAETQQGWQSQAEVTKEACQQPAAEGGVEGEGQTEETTEFTKRNQASKVDAMMSLQVELPPLPASNGTRSNDQLISGAVLPSEKKHVDMSFGSLEMATQLVHAKGGGSHGPKFIALNLKLNRRVVCWRFVAPKHLEMARRALLQDSVTEEVQHLQTLRHPCICPYYAGEVVDGQLYVVTGYAPGGSVADWLADAGPLAEAPTQRVVRSVLEGLRYLHSHDVAHGAIRGGNVLLGPGSAIRLCDFGLSTLREGSVAGSVPKGKTSESSALSQSAVPWMAPEVLQGLIPTASSDIWSLACLVAGELGWERCPQHRPGEVSGSCMQKGRRWFFKVQGPINTAIQANDLWPLPEAIAKAGYGFPMQK